MDKNSHFIPIREATHVLSFKLIGALFLTELTYLLIHELIIHQPFWSYTLFTGIILLIGSLATTCIQAYLVIHIVLKWLYFYAIIKDQRLVQKFGILQSQEKTHELLNIFSIEIDKDLFGKLFHYGTLTLTYTTMSGNNEEVHLTNIYHPEKIQGFIEEYINTIRMYHSFPEKEKEHSYQVFN